MLEKSPSGLIEASNSNDFLQTDGYRSLDRYLQLYNGTLAYGFMDDKLDRVMQYGTI